MERRHSDLRFSKRLLKVHYHHYPESKQPHPMIKLGGIYLSRLDFQIGDEIEVLAEPGKIVIIKK